MSSLKILTIESSIIWEDVAGNLEHYDSLLAKFFSFPEKRPDIVIFPEFFTMGFTMNPQMAETDNGPTTEWMRSRSKQYGCAITGSLAVKTSSGIVNRALFITPEGEEYVYDKRHLFRMGEENEHYVKGEKRSLFAYKGWNISLNICYDLRFPVWSRNVNNEYDLLINVANWPKSRIGVTEHLVKSRAIENQSYYIFANRDGSDPVTEYNGFSRVVNFKGEDIGEKITLSETGMIYAELSLESLREFREKFPAYMDADEFRVLN